MKKKFCTNLIFILIFSAMLSLCACGNSGGESPDEGRSQTSGSSITESDSKATEADTEKQTDSTNDAGPAGGRKMTDPSGAEISIPEQIDSIVVLAPSLSEIVTSLGLADKITGYDTYSVGLKGLPEDVPTFEITNPDMEQLTALSPDILLVTNETMYDQESPFQTLEDAGTCVICVPTSDDIPGIQSDIEFLAAALGASEKGSALLDDFNKQLDELTDIAAEIPEKERKRVYFEIAPAPNMYSFGSGVYLNEMIELIGAENILSDQPGWITVEGETIVAANPDVIFTNVSYTDDPIQEILDRDGWAGISAVANKNVYYIDKDFSSQPNHNIIKAMRQMAEYLYPDYYKK